ncbi:MAG: hypothetical protein JWP75_3801, partial [Frondihabitans sp.]|nr:hypothetical protein [Frondihabitans sp.]
PTSQLSTVIEGTSTTEAPFADTLLPTAKDSAGHYVTADFGFAPITFAATSGDWLHSPFEN